MNVDCPWNIEIIDDESSLLRHISANKRISKRDHKYPGADHFALREDIGETSLSFNWDKYADVEKSYIVLGITKGREDAFLDCSGYVFYNYPIQFLKSLPKFEKIIHDPSWNGNPAPEGKPNNRAHSGLFCGSFDNGTRAILSLHCQNNPTAQIRIKFKVIKDEIELLKQRASNTPYHKDWNFEK